jgi:hypothetical protein
MNAENRIAILLHSQSALFKPRLRAFSDTARLTESLAPSGNSVEISTTTFTDAFGSDCYPSVTQ